MISNNDLLIKQVLDEADEHLSESRKVGDHYIDGIPYYYHPNDENLEMEASQITHNIKRAWSFVLSILERYDHPTLLSEAREEYGQYLKTPLKTEMGIDEPFLYWPYQVQTYVDVLRSLYVEKNVKGIDSKQKHVVEIITRSDSFLTNRDIFGFAPCKELDIHDRLEGLLQCSFRDVKRMPSISKAIKNFEPDTSIHSLNILIEYKYVTTKNDCKRVVDEIIADIGGYQTTRKNLIIFVVYETGRFFHSDDWERVISESNPPSPVEHILIKGIEPTEEDTSMRKQYESLMRKRKRKAKQQPKDKHQAKPEKNNEARTKAR